MLGGLGAELANRTDDIEASGEELIVLGRAIMRASPALRALRFAPTLDDVLDSIVVDSYYKTTLEEYTEYLAGW